jgi:predicted nuclease with TOPRIM domain
MKKKKKEIIENSNKDIKNKQKDLEYSIIEIKKFQNIKKFTEMKESLIETKKKIENYIKEKERIKREQLMYNNFL